MRDESFNFTGTGEPERLQGRLVSAEFLSTLGIKPLVGRDFLAEEDAAPAAHVPAGCEKRFERAQPGNAGLLEFLEISQKRTGRAADADCSVSRPQLVRR